MVVRLKSMQGLDCPYVPGWDCHGLPIEHKVVTELVESGKFEKLKTLDDWQRRNAIRRECQKHAEKYVKLQATQMQRLLTIADYEHPYLTMAKDYEGATLEVLAELMERGLVYRALKPVHWSIANETALADAELEYYDREDLSVYVDFEAVDGDAVYGAFGLQEKEDEENAEVAEGAEERGEETDGEAGEVKSAAPKPGMRPLVRPSFMIWTTTPWTLPANLAIAVNPKFEYALVWVDGNVTVMAKDAIDRVTKRAKAEEVVVLATAQGSRLVGLKYRHPFVDLGEGHSVMAVGKDGTSAFAPASLARVFSIVAADYVTLEDGTGLVHTAPGHGEEDYLTANREGLPIYCPVKGDGTYDGTVPEWLTGQSVWDANPKVVKHLRDSGHLFFDHVFTHSYPHDWRSKTPTIFRCTEQWFVGVDRSFSIAGEASPSPRSLRERALDATGTGGGDGEVAFVPDWGRNRMRGMLESRPDWCISRQRSWGLPIPAFVLPDGSVFMTPASVRAVIAVVREKGSDAWFTLSTQELLKDYELVKDKDAPRSLTVASLMELKKGQDILDVWFESGSSWNAVLRQRNLGYPADLYLEGSDQHRGWFQLSLLPALGVTGRPPFKTILTHGFMVDKDGRKLSKSRTDAARYEVESLASEFGVDVMRWWVSSLPYENDVKVDLEFFTVAGESYRKVRNTLRFLLSNLADYVPMAGGATRDKAVPPTSVDAWVLAEFDALSTRVVGAYNAFDFRSANQALYHFCNTTLSAVYLAAVKDRLYCDRADSPRRRQTQNTLWELTDGLCRLLAPILCHTSDEAYRALWKAGPDDPRCVHVETFTASSVTADPRWVKVMEAREQAQSAIEAAKAGLGVENPLDAGVVLPDPEGALTAFDPVDMADLLGVSEVTLDRAAREPRVLDLRSRARCERSWKRDGTVKERGDGGLLSDRDAAAVGVV